MELRFLQFQIRTLSLTWGSTHARPSLDATLAILLVLHLWLFTFPTTRTFTTPMYRPSPYRITTVNVTPSSRTDMTSPPWETGPWTSNGQPASAALSYQGAWTALGQLCRTSVNSASADIAGTGQSTRLHQ